MVLVKRYANRKLYDTEQGRYVTLADVRDMIQAGQDVCIRDHASGEDLTARIYARILFDLEKEARGTLPEQVLGGIIRAGEHGLEKFRELLPGGLEVMEQVEQEICSRLDLLEKHDFLETDEAQRLRDLLLLQSQRLRILEARERAQVQQDTLESLRLKVAELEDRLEAMQD